MQFATLNGITLHYQVIGAAPEKPQLVFINSLGTDFRIWRDVIVRFVGEAGIVTYDKRGHGLTEATPAPYTIDDHVGDLIALLDHLGVKGAVIVGLSVGGLIAQSLASKRPDLVRALVLCDTGMKIGNEAIWNQRIEAIQSKGMEAIGDAVMERWFTPDFRDKHADEVAGYRTMMTRIPMDGYIGTCAAIRDADLTDIATTLPQPTACIVGDQDVSTTPAIVAEMAKTIPGARYDVIKDCGHLPCVEQPHMLADIIKAFVADIAAG